MLPYDTRGQADAGTGVFLYAAPRDASASWMLPPCKLASTWARYTKHGRMHCSRYGMSLRHDTVNRITSS